MHRTLQFLILTPNKVQMIQVGFGSQLSPHAIVRKYQVVINQLVVFIFIQDFQANLAPHYKIQIEIQLSRFGDWNGDRFEVYVDNALSYQKLYLNEVSAPMCNSMQYREALIVFIINHNFRSALFLLRALSAQATSDTIYWGIKKFKISIQECSPQCDYCRFENDDCQWSLAYSSMTKMYENNRDGWTYPYLISLEEDNCCEWIYQPSTYGQKLFQLTEHDYIKIRIKHRESFTLVVDEIFITYYRQKQWLPEQYSVCETESIYHIASTAKVKIIAQNEFWFRDFELFIGKKILELQPQCLQQVNSKCIQCQEGWDFESNNNLKCLPICGDGLIRGNEECENQNNLNTYHNCVKCKFQCDPFCINCKFGVCQQCYEGYYLNEKNICKEQCQNKSLKQINNQNQFDQTIDQICFKQIFQCEKGWYFKPLLQECQTICGDGLIRGHEECDFGSNSNQIEGCANCKYQCDPYCVNCRQRICSVCKKGYYLNGKKICEWQCQEKSVTTIINQQYDYTNKNIEQSCFSSFLKNEEGYNFDTNKQQCKTICGDEQCDYGNNQYSSDN